MGSLQVYKDNVEVIPKRGLSTFLNMVLLAACSPWVAR